MQGDESPSHGAAEQEHQLSQRELDLQRLREHLERNPPVASNLTGPTREGRDHDSYDEKRPEESEKHSENHSPDNGKHSQRAKRKVQWVGLSEGDHPDHHDHTHLHPPHVSVSVPTTPNYEPSGFNWSEIGIEGSDGARTPGAFSSGGATPDNSRPPTPEQSFNIPSGERDGLPLASSKRGRTFTREAAKLVAMHKAKSMFTSKKRHSHDHSETSPSRSKSVKTSILSHVPAKNAIYDDEVPAGSHSRSQGTGVLSALLKLYEQPHSAVSSQATLVQSQSRSGSPTDHSPTATSGPGAPNNTPATHRAPEKLHTPPSFSDRDRKGSSSPLGNLIRGAAHRISDYHHDNYERPAAAKSKGGVFGALQASAIGLAGAATPTGATVSPAPQRPGYRLDRHSLPDIPTRKDFTDSPGQLTPEKLSPTHSHTHTPRPSLHQRKTGTALSLGSIAKASEHFAKSSEALAKEHLNPSRYHRESSVFKAAKSSGSVPSSPRNEAVDEKLKGVRRRKDKRRQEEIFITMHVAAILQRQDFILRLARALMMFGAPSHRMEYQLQQTAKVLEIDCQIIYIVNFMIISFSDPDTHTSEIRFIKQTAGLDLGKLTDIAILHWEVVHDKIGVEEASVEISNLMKSKPFYNNWWLTAFGAWCSMMIGIASFNTSFVDLLIAAPLGAFLVAVQCFIAARSDILSSIFEIVIAAIISFTAAALASTGTFCYASITSASIVLILPGWPTCVAALELQSRSIVSGSVRLVYAVVYSLFLGFGISLGANLWVLFSGDDVQTSNDNTCSLSHMPDGPWWQQDIPQWLYFLAVPGFPLGLALRNHARWNKELVVMILIAGAGWNANHWSTYGFPGRSDISSALGALVVGLLGNIYGKFFQSTAFIVSCVPILFQLPSGLGNGGLLNWATTNADQQAIFSSGWSVAQQLITVVIGLVVGLLFSCAIIYPFGKRRGGLMTF